MGPLPYVIRANGADALRPTRIARAVGVTPETVRERIQRMEKSGLLAGYDVVPNLRHLGLEAESFLIFPPDEARLDELRNAVEFVEGLLEVTYFLGCEVCVDLSFATPRERDRRLAALCDVAGDPEPKPFFGWGMPPVTRALTQLDWRIIRALRGRADRPLPEVADEIGVGYRTVKRHYDRMATEGSFFVRPLVDPTKEPGLVPVALLFFFGPDGGAATVANILRTFDDQRVFGAPPSSPKAGNMDLLALAGSAAEVEAMRRKGAAIPGVARVRALMLTGIDPRMGWIDERIEAMLARPSPMS